MSRATWRRMSGRGGGGHESAGGAGAAQGRSGYEQRQEVRWGCRQALEGAAELTRELGTHPLGKEEAWNVKSRGGRICSDWNVCCCCSYH